MNYIVKTEGNRTSIHDEKGKLVCYVQNELVAYELIKFWETILFDRLHIVLYIFELKLKGHRILFQYHLVVRIF